MEGDIAEMGKFIGAGLATIGLGGAGIGVGHIAGNFLVGRPAQPVGGPRPDGQPLRRHRLRRSSRDLLVPDRPSADVRRLILTEPAGPDRARPSGPVIPDRQENDMATEATEAAGHGGEAVGMPQLDFSTWPNQIFWLLVTLVVIYLRADAHRAAPHRGGAGRAQGHDHQRPRGSRRAEAKGAEGREGL